MNIINKCTIASAMGAVICTSASGLASETIFEQNTGGEVSNSGFDFSTFKWASMEVTVAGAYRSNPTFTLDLFDSFAGSRNVTMHLFVGDGSTTQLGNGLSAFASQTVTTADLGSNAMNGTSVSWDFSGITIPDNIVIALEVADSDGTGASIFASVFGSSSGSSPIIGSNFGYNESRNNGFSWFFDSPSGNLNFSFSNFSITAVPLPSAALSALGLIAGIGAYRRIRR